MLLAIIITAYVTLPWLSRYDWLFVIAITVQMVMLATKLEQPHEVITIVAFHLVGLGMEVFKTSGSIQAWAYHGPAMFHVANVPLFSGFMYAAVGSYIARSWRVLQLGFSSYPSRAATAVLATAIYVNFFTHHYIYDFRYLLFIVVIFLYGRVWVSYVINMRVRRMPLVVGFGLIAFVIWLAENAATYLRVWLYPSQEGQWHIVDISKVGSWFLLMIISFILVDLLYAIRSKLNRPTLAIKDI